DLSYNNISSVDPQLLENLTSLEELDLSNNQISTLEDGVFDNLFNLTTINLSLNPLVCDCKLSWLACWLNVKGVTLVEADATTCDRPALVVQLPLLSVNFSTFHCGFDCVACLTENCTGTNSVIVFSSLSPGNFTRDSCNARCYIEDQEYGVLGSQNNCLCGRRLEQVAPLQNTWNCTDPDHKLACSQIVIQDVFKVQLSAFFSELRTFSIYEAAVLNISITVNVSTLLWDFGDQTQLLNTTENIVVHKYALPGKYIVNVTLFMGAKVTSAHTEINVVIPPEKMELQCPSLVKTNASVDIRIQNVGGTSLRAEYSITSHQGEIKKDLHAPPFCPSDGLIFHGNNHCYQLVQINSTWQEAQLFCRSYNNSDLVVVRSTEVQSFLLSLVEGRCSVWIGLSDAASAGTLQWVDGFMTESYQGFLLEEVQFVPGKTCVSLSTTGQLVPESCTAKNSFICERKPEERISNSDYFLEGNPIFSTNVPLKILTRNQTISEPLGTVEVMMFPGLWFKHEGEIQALEFVTQDLNSSVQLRFQIYRPTCFVHSGKQTPPFVAGKTTTVNDIKRKEKESRKIKLKISTPPKHWCHIAKQCLPLSSPCSLNNCNNGSSSDPPRYNGTQPSYLLVKEALVNILPGSSTHYLVLLGNEDITVNPEDIVTFQHDAGPGSLLYCPWNTMSPWKQSYFSVNHTDWTIGTFDNFTNTTWTDNSVCHLRVLYTSKKETKVISPFLNSGLYNPGLYTFQARVENGASSNNLSCSFHVMSPISGLRVIYPAIQNDIYYVPSNQTFIVVKISSGNNATAWWMDGNQTFPFQTTCPPELSPSVEACHRDTNDTWFSKITLALTDKSVNIVVVLAENRLSSQNLTLKVKAEDPITGLRAIPDPGRRVLVNTYVRYTAVMDTGSDVAVKWTVDVKESFTFYNVVFNVIYQSAAVYKLLLMASNHISSARVNYNVTVDKMCPMADLKITGVLTVITQNSSLVLTASVKVDTAVDATFRWNFGDGGWEVHQFKPPYNHSFPVLDPTKKQVLIENNVSYTYKVPGEYTLVLFVSNMYENLSQQVQVYVYSSLTGLTIEADTDILVAGRPVTFEAYPLPSSYGIVYNWSFGDSSMQSTGNQSRVTHVFEKNGTYNVSVDANNTFSTKNAQKSFVVLEKITGLKISSNEPTELHTPTIVTASVETGDNITWVFEMGDGTLLKNVKPVVEHTYLKEFNYTINVTAQNAAGSVSKTLDVEVFVLEVLRIEPSSCIQELLPTTFTAYVSGNSSNYVFDWTFGDGSSNITICGSPVVTHTFTMSGLFPLSLVLSSNVNKAHYFTNNCVEPSIASVKLISMNEFIKLREESIFKVDVLPKYQYRYLWDFGTTDSSRFSGDEVSFTYGNPGVYLVTVTVFNNISSNNDTTLVEVQEPVGMLKIEHNGTSVIELNQMYTFIAIANGTKVRYMWDFDDGYNQTGQVVTHTYNYTDTFTVNLKGWNEVSSNETSIELTVRRAIQGVTICASRTVVPLNGSVSFVAHLQTGDDVRYSWILCDRCTPILGSSTISYTFRSIGTFNVIVIAENEISCMQDSIFVYVLQMIEGLQIIGNDLVNGCCFETNKTLQLQAAVKDGTNISYSWTVFSDEVIVHNINGKLLNLNIPEVGIYVVILKATNMLGTMTVNRTVEFIEPIGVLKLTAVPNPVAVNESFNLSLGLTSGSGVRYTWFLEDTLTISTTGSFLIYQFQTPGIKQINVTAKNKLSVINVTLSVFVQEPIVGLTINTTEPQATYYVTTGSTVIFHGELQKGTNVFWWWTLPDSNKHGQTMPVSFFAPGTFTISLNASNDISWAVAERNITVQDEIQGLELLVDKKVVAPGEKVLFSIKMSTGTSVSYLLSISGDSSVLLNNSNYSHEFTRVGNYSVTVTATNQVSSAKANVLISVLEPISGLRIVNCCEKAIPTGIVKKFDAEVSGGSQVSYIWQFHLHNHSLVTYTGKSVSYTPVVAGKLTVLLNGCNNLGIKNVTQVIQAQDQIVLATLKVKTANTYVNRTVAFEALVTPSSRQVVFFWDFGDGFQNVTDSVTAFHIYLAPGDYLIQVNATNLISFFVTQVTITTRVLECEDPEVKVDVPSQTIMKRSQRNYLEAQVDLKGCTSYQTEYAWQIYHAPSCGKLEERNKVQLFSVDLTRPQLVIPRLALDTGDYCFAFSVSFVGTPLSQSSLANVTVVPGSLVPIIDGGSYRVWSNTQDLIMNGKNSYDPNLEDDDQTPLQYYWSCKSSTKQNPSGCLLNVTSEKGIFKVSRNLLEAGVEYSFHLTVSKPGMSAESTNQTVLVKNGTVPIVSLECVSCKAQSVYEVSKSSYVYLAGTCINCQDSSPHGLWTAQSLNNKTLALDTTTTSTGNTGMNLVLRQGVLSDGDGYIFSLNVTDPSLDNEGFASIALLPNNPPAGGLCWISPSDVVSALVTEVQFQCSGWRDTEEEEASLIYSLIVTRCKVGQCDRFCVYRGSRSEHSALLPPGFQANHFNIDVSVIVEDQQGAAVVALNQSMTVHLPGAPEGFQSLSHWLYYQTETVLLDLMKQGDPQQVIELSLALITVLNEYEQITPFSTEPKIEGEYRIMTRNNITHALISLKVNTVDDIQQISAALAQCTVVSNEFVLHECQRKTLTKLETMMFVLQDEMTQGTGTPTVIADNILNIMGDLIHQVNQNSQQSKTVEEENLCSSPHPQLVASKAYGLSSELMRILMRSRVLNEEPLTLEGGEITAQGKRANPLNLLCYNNISGCQFSLPQAFNGTFSDLSEVTQVMFRVDSNPFPFGYISNYTVSTNVASMQFQMDNGTEIPIVSLDSDTAITVMVSNNSAVKNVSAGVAVVVERSSVVVVVRTGNTNKAAALHLQITYRVLDDRYVLSEAEPFIQVYLHDSANPNEYNLTAMKNINMEMMKGSDHKPYTFFIAPQVYDTTKDYYLNVTNHYHWSSVEVTVGVYISLCQYFDEKKQRWETEGIVPVEDTSPDRAVCLTQHLTAFGASLFVPPDSVQFIFPAPRPGLNYIILLTCAVCFVMYAVVAIIVRKLDLIDIGRIGVIPFCGPDGLYKYEVLVKTGWGRGSGTTAHVGISLYGKDCKSGHRHLDGETVFHRNSLDVFQIATENSLGSIWKIRIWHDNKGLSPSWYLQHVIVKDLQNSESYFFLVNDWLSVDNEKNEGMVEKEVLIATDAELTRFSRLFVAELQRGFSEKHIWLSLWERPPRSRFTRVQRATCCTVLIYLFFCANAVWYGVVGDKRYSMFDVAVSNIVPVSGESVAVGLVSSFIIYPIYLLVLLLFRMARSKASVSQSLKHLEQQSLEIDDYLDSSTPGSSFITFTTFPGEAFSDQIKTDTSLGDLKSLACETKMNWPDLLNDPSIMGGNIPKLKRGKGSRHLGIDASITSDEENLSLGFNPTTNQYFTASDEDLIRQILAGGAGHLSTQRESGPFSSRAETDLISGLTSVFGEKTEAIMLQKLNERGQAVSRSPMQSARSTRTVAAADSRRWLFPYWCSYLAHVLSFLLFSGSIGVSVWIGIGLTSSVGLMWLISGIFSFLSSFLILEPLKILMEAFYFALVVKRLHPEEDDSLVEDPLVEHISEKINKVRPPQGFALFQAKEEGKKIKMLHKMLKDFLVYMLFLLVVLLINYGDSDRDINARLLQRAVRHQLVGEEPTRISRPEELWVWLSDVVLPYLYSNQSVRHNYLTVLGSPRLRQIRSQQERVQNYFGKINLKCTSDSTGVNIDPLYKSNWKRTILNLNSTWKYLLPDLTGVWYWGWLSLYDSGGYIEEMGRTAEESTAILGDLESKKWLDKMTRAVFIEFTQYNANVDLYTVVTLLLEFPISGGAFAIADIKPITLLRLSTGVHLLLIMMVFLMIFVVYFVVVECLSIKKEGKAYFSQIWNYIQWFIILLSVCSVVLHLNRVSLADQQWAKFLNNREAFTNFYQIAFLSYTFINLSAVLLFLLTLKATRQLRFIRQWSLFGKTLYVSARELLCAGVAFILLVLAYTQLGYLLFSAHSDNFRTFSSGLLSLIAALRGSVSLKLGLPEGSGIYIYCMTYIAMELCVILWLFAAVLIQNYRLVRSEMYRPAFALQDYEMVELFMRRLKMWMGISKTKEFRHKVRFEGMAPLPSRSSSDSKSLRIPTPGAISNVSTSSTISSQLDNFNPVSGGESSEVEANLQHLFPVFETVLMQFDKLNKVTEDIYQIECQLEAVQNRIMKKKMVQTSPTNEDSALFVPQKRRTSAIPVKKRKATGAKNKVHPNNN
uniref:Polycystin 1, transient receptor potential channel interacting n=1 Tax=Latimeria chalumnae TaxID=7897 RepID=H3A3K9_LATCH